MPQRTGRACAFHPFLARRAEPMRRSSAVIFLSWLYIAAGVVGLIYHAMNWSPDEPVADQAWVLALRVLAVVGGLFTLRGAIWSRWLLVAWIAYHVFLIIGLSNSQLAVHAVMFLLTALVLIPRPRNTRSAGQ